MGTIISLKQLGEQWKTIVVCLAGLAGMCLACWLVCIPIIGMGIRRCGLPPLTGGIVELSPCRLPREKGLRGRSSFAIGCTACRALQATPHRSLPPARRQKLLKKFRSGEVKTSDAAEVNAVEKANELEAGTANKAKKKLIPELPEKWNGPVMIFLKLGIVAWLPQPCSAPSHSPASARSPAVWALILGVLGTTIGFLDVNSLNKANSYGIVMFALMMYVFDGLEDCYPPQCSVPLSARCSSLIVVGVIGMAIFEFIAAKLLKIDFCLALANGLTALYGFPQCHHHREHLQGSGRDQGRVRLPHGRNVPQHDRRRLHHRHYHLRYHRRPVHQPVLIRYST